MVLGDLNVPPGKNERIDYLDTLKAVSMFLVIFCHYVMLPNGSILGNVLMSLSWAAVPCFMMTSGFLMHRKEVLKPKGYFRRLSHIYAAYVIWRLIYLAVYFAFGKVRPTIKEVISYLFFARDLAEVNTGAMWYIVAYIAVLLLYPVTHFLYHGGNKGKRVLAFLGCIAGVRGLLVPSVNWLIEKIMTAAGTEPISISYLNGLNPIANSANMLFYFILGAFLFEYRKEITAFIDRHRLLPYALVLTGTAGIMFAKYVETGAFGWNGVYLTGGYTRITTLVASVGLFLCAASGRGHSPIRFLGRMIGKYTMGIYYIHYILLAACSSIVYGYFRPYYSFGLNILKTILTAAFCTAVTIVMRKLPGIRILVE